jgi:hypothetical protein
MSDVEVGVVVVPTVEKYGVDQEESQTNSHEDESILHFAAKDAIEECVEFIVEECHDTEPESSVEDTQECLRPGCLSVENPGECDVQDYEGDSSDPQELWDLVQVLGVDDELVHEEGPQQETVVGFPVWSSETAVTRLSHHDICRAPHWPLRADPPS